MDIELEELMNKLETELLTLPWIFSIPLIWGIKLNIKLSRGNKEKREYILKRLEDVKIRRMELKRLYKEDMEN